MIKLEPETIAQFEKFIIPEIKGAAEDSLRAYEQGARPDGTNNFDNYMLGCSCWNNVYNRLNRELEQHPFFSKKNYKKVLVITCLNGKEELKFCVSRVDEEKRIPCAGKSIKLSLQNQAFLSEEIQNIVSKSTQNCVFMLGYDISTSRGLGKISFDMLSYVSKGKFQSDSIYIFNEEEASLASSLPHEELKHPVVTRDALLTSIKKSKK